MPGSSLFSREAAILINPHRMPQPFENKGIVQEVAQSECHQRLSAHVRKTSALVSCKNEFLHGFMASSWLVVLAWKLTWKLSLRTKLNPHLGFNPISLSTTSLKLRDRHRSEPFCINKAKETNPNSATYIGHRFFFF